MPQATTITVADRESTPVNHTYIPDNRDDNGWWRFVESDGTPVGNNLLLLRKTVSASGLIKLSVRMQDPVVVDETINGVVRSTELRMAQVGSEWIFSPHSTLQERKNLVGKKYNLMGSAQTFMMKFLQDVEGIYG